MIETITVDEFATSRMNVAAARRMLGPEAPDRLDYIGTCRASLMLIVATVFNGAIGWEVDDVLVSRWLADKGYEAELLAAIEEHLGVPLNVDNYAATPADVA